MGRACAAPPARVLYHLSRAPRFPPPPGLDADSRWIPARSLGGSRHDGERLIEFRPRWYLGEPAVGQAANPLVSTRRLRPEPKRDGALHRQRRQARPRDLRVFAVEGHALLGPQPAEQRDLLFDATAPVREILAERLIFDRVPSEPDAEPEVTPSEQVDLRRLLGRERGLPLRQDDDPGDKLERCDPSQVTEEDHRLVEGRVHVIRARPGRMDLRVGAQDMVVREGVREAKLLDPLRVGAHRAHVSADLRLGEHDAYPHGASYTWWVAGGRRLRLPPPVPRTPAARPL